MSEVVLPRPKLNAYQTRSQKFDQTFLLSIGNATLLDTDMDWTDRARMASRKAKVHVMPCQPCFEAMLLSVHRAPVEGRTTAQLKQDFAGHFGASASDASISRHFSREVLEEARFRITILNELWSLLTKAEI